MDDIYYYGGGIQTEQLAIMPHKARNANEFDFQVGDKIGIAGNHWNGMSKGKNLRTNKVRIQNIIDMISWCEIILTTILDVLNKFITGWTLSVI